MLLCRQGKMILTTLLVANWLNKRKGDLLTQGNVKLRDSFRFSFIQEHQWCHQACKLPSSLLLHLWHLFLTGHWPLSERSDFSSALLISSVTGDCELNWQKTANRRKSIHILFDISILTWHGSFIERSENPKETVRLESLYAFLTNNKSLRSVKTKEKGVWAGEVNCGKAARKYMAETNGR